MGTFEALEHRQKWTSKGDPVGTKRGVRRGKKIGNLIDTRGGRVILAVL